MSEQFVYVLCLEQDSKYDGGYFEVLDVYSSLESAIESCHAMGLFVRCKRLDGKPGHNWITFFTTTDFLYNDKINHWNITEYNETEFEFTLYERVLL